MRWAFDWNDEAINNLEALAAGPPGGDASDPVYAARLDLFQYVFSTGFDNGDITNRVINPNYEIFQEIHAVYQQISEFDTTTDGSPESNPYPGTLPVDEFIMYCDYNRLAIYYTCNDQIAWDITCDKEVGLAVRWGPEDMHCMDPWIAFASDTTQVNSNPPPGCGFLLRWRLIICFWPGLDYPEIPCRNQRVAGMLKYALGNLPNVF
jgi:hypothetical protein